MLPYIPRIDEILTAPPYQLGSEDQGDQGRFQADMFVVPADHDRLQDVLDRYLNAALPPSGKLRYTVPSSVQRMFIGFYRYGCAQSTLEPNKGWLKYKEVMFGFLAMRPPLPNESDHNRLVTYLGVVYIDQYDNDDAPCDPYPIPVILGRESYGLPKNPAKIYYAPSRLGPQRPRLQIWDTAEEGGRLELRDALRISDQSYLERLRGTPHPLLRRSEPKPDGDKTGSLHVLANMLGTSRGALNPRDHPSPATAHGEVFLDLPDHQDPVVAYKSLAWGTTLVGLKQFPDPASDAKPPDGMGEAAYRAVIEVPLKEVGETISSPTWPLSAQRLEFPPTQRVDLPGVFGIPVEGARREISIPKDAVFYTTGVLAFANPREVATFDRSMD